MLSVKSLLAILFAASVAIPGTGQTPPVHPLTGRQIASVATDAVWLDRSEREQEEDPERALDLVGITPGLVVADVGAGSGYMSGPTVMSNAPCDRRL